MPASGNSAGIGSEQIDRIWVILFSVKERVERAAIMLKKKNRKIGLVMLNMTILQSHWLSQEKPVFDDSIDVFPDHFLWLEHLLNSSCGFFGCIRRTLSVLLCTRSAGERHRDFPNYSGGTDCRCELAPWPSTLVQETVNAVSGTLVSTASRHISIVGYYTWGCLFWKHRRNPSRG